MGREKLLLPVADKPYEPPRIRTHKEEARHLYEAIEKVQHDKETPFKGYKTGLIRIPEYNKERKDTCLQCGEIVRGGYDRLIYRSKPLTSFRSSPPVELISPVPVPALHTLAVHGFVGRFASMNLILINHTKLGKVLTNPVELFEGDGQWTTIVPVARVYRSFAKAQKRSMRPSPHLNGSQNGHI